MSTRSVGEADGGLADAEAEDEDEGGGGEEVNEAGGEGGSEHSDGLHEVGTTAEEE